MLNIVRNHLFILNFVRAAIATKDDTNFQCFIVCGKLQLVLASLFQITVAPAGRW
ncbi:MAG: hypothetical protein WDO15_11175 [Bacteroidota bacterium]